MNFKCVLVALVLFAPSLAVAKEEPQTLEQRCTSDEASSYRGTGERSTYVFDVLNKCAKPLRCSLHISILNSYGLARGDKVVMLAPKSHGTLELKVKTAGGGMNMRSHRCKEV